MTTPDVSAPAAPAPKGASLWEDFVDIFYAPRAVFERRRDGRFGVPLLVYTAFAALIATFTVPMMAPIFDRQIDRQVETMRERGADDRAVASARGFAEKMRSPVAGAITGAVSTPIAVAIVAALLWGAGKLFGSVATFGQAMMVTTYASIPRILGMIVSAGLLLVADPSSLTSMASVSFSPARFMSPDTDVALLALVQRFDLFTLWVTVLLGIGLSVVGKISRGKAMGAAAIVFLAATLGAIVSALRQAA